MWNLVTEQWIGTDQTSEWYNSIQEFTAIPRWIPKGFYSDKETKYHVSFYIVLKLLGMDPLTHSGLSGFGPSYDMLPLDVNVTFFFDYVKGTVETIEIINITDSGNTSLGGTSDFLLGRFHVILMDAGTWYVTDKFDARAFRISYEFPFVRKPLSGAMEQVHHITFSGRNHECVCDCKKCV